MSGEAHHGVVAAGHPLTAKAGAWALHEGGNAVDAGIASVLASMVAEPLLTGLAAGGYMLVCAPSGEQVLIDFFVSAPDPGSGNHAALVPVDVSFGDAIQRFNIGAASCGVFGTPAGLELAAKRFGTMPLEALVTPAASYAREGVRINARQAYVFEILAAIITATPGCAQIYAPGGKPLSEGDIFRNPEFADSLDLFGQEGSTPFYTGEVASAIIECLESEGGLLKREDLDSYEAVEREPVSIAYRGRDVLTNPPPSAGGVLIAYALALLERNEPPPSLKVLIGAMQDAQKERTPEFLEGLERPGFLEEFAARKLGSTTHISVLDRDGWACSVTCSNGEGCGIVAPGTGIHLNNMLGEEDLNPLGFFKHEAGRRLPSMMSPTVVMRDGTPELVVGSAGSNRIRSAVLQTIINVVDKGMTADEAVWAPRVHIEGGLLSHEPGVDVSAEIAELGLGEQEFRALNLFFGGVQAVERDPKTGVISGCGDPRRGGAAIAV